MQQPIKRGAQRHTLFPKGMAVVCPVCPHACALQKGQKGLCGARKNTDGKIEDYNYGRVTALALDPIEKKPLARFYPGRQVLSVGSFGCNLRCRFCQNHDVAHPAGETRTQFVSPEELVQRAKDAQPEGNIGIAFTYNEPLVGYEYVRDTARLCHAAALKTILVTNGYVCEEILAELLPHIDALNIDLKCFTEDGYKRLGGSLSPVKRSIQMAAQAAHVEVTTLVVPGLSDGEEEMREEAAWLASLSPDTPLHLSRYFPRWRETAEATPVGQLQKLQEIAQKYLKHVYLGNC